MTKDRGLSVSRPHCIITFSALLAIASFAGCGMQSNLVSKATGSSSTFSLQGHVHGGQQPLVGATIQLYAAGMPASGGGYGQGAVPLISGTVLTDQNGDFMITGLYPTQTTATEFYIVSSGGSPGFGSPVNSDAVLFATISGCTPSTTLSSSTFIDISEVSTVAAVSALRPFMATPTGVSAAPNIGVPSSAAADLRNAFESINNIASQQTGGTISHATNWSAVDTNGPLVYTLADIAAYCVNSDPATSVNCSTLFADARPSTSVPAAANATEAMYYILSNATQNAGPLFNLIPPTPPFVALSSAPSTFALTPVATATSACQAPATLGTAANFEVLGATTVTNTGATVITGGDLGLSPGTSVTGFPPGTLTSPAMMQITNSAAFQAQSDMSSAFTSMMALPGGTALPADIGGLTLTPGLYSSSSSLGMATTSLTLDGQGDSNAVFIFQIGSTFITGPSTQINLINGAQAKNIFWVVGSSATIGTASSIQGNILAAASIGLNSTASVQGRVLAHTAAVTLDTNVVSAP